MAAGLSSNEASRDDSFLVQAVSSCYHWQEANYGNLTDPICMIKHKESIFTTLLSTKMIHPTDNTAIYGTALWRSKLGKILIKIPQELFVDCKRSLTGIRLCR